MKHNPKSSQQHAKSTVYLATRDDQLISTIRSVVPESSIVLCQTYEQFLAADHSRPDTISIADARDLPGDSTQRNRILGRERMLVVADTEADATVRFLAEHERVNHVLMRSDDGLKRQLPITIARMSNNMPYSLENYLDTGTIIATEQLVAADAKQACINRIAASARLSTGFSELSAVVATIASELVMNAIFNAPHDATGTTPRYKDRPRHESLQLAPGEEVKIAYGHDDHVFALSIRDNFGALTRQTLVENVLRSSKTSEAQIKMKTAGAGVGLYMVFSSCTQLDITVNRNQSTEFVAVVAISKRYRDFASGGHSINLYFDARGDRG